MTITDLCHPQTQTLRFTFIPDMKDISGKREASPLFPKGRPVIKTFGDVKPGEALQAETKTCSLTPRFQYAGGVSYIPERSGLLCVFCEKCGRGTKVDTVARADAISRVTLVCGEAR